MITRRAVIQGASLLGAALGLAACSPAAQQSPASTESSAQKLTLGLSYIPNVQFSAFYLGVDSGIFADLGIDLELRHHGEQEDLFGALASGHEDVVFASADEAMVASAGGQELITFATSYQRYPAEVILRGKAEQLSELAGKSLGIPGRFGSSYYAALCALHEAGLSENEVKLQEIGYTQLAAVEGGRVDAIIGFRNNELIQLKEMGVEVTSLPVSDPASPRLVGPSLITSKVEDIGRDLLVKLGEGMAKAQQSVIDNPEAALDATAKRVPALADAAQRTAAAKVLDATAELWLIDGKVDASVPVESFERMGRFLQQVGIIDQIPTKSYLS